MYFSQTCPANQCAGPCCLVVVTEEGAWQHTKWRCILTCRLDDCARRLPARGQLLCIVMRQMTMEDSIAGLRRESRSCQPTWEDSGPLVSSPHPPCAAP
jgi:hypothetical protein